MARLLILFALFIGALTQSPTPISPENLDILNGFLDGSQLRKALPDILGCGVNTTSIFDSFSRASVYFGRSPLTIDDIEGGIREIGFALDSLGLVMIKCTSIPDKFYNIFHYASNVINNTTYFIHEAGVNIMKNLCPIFNDLSDIKDVYNNRNFYEFGRRLGEIAGYIFNVQFPQIKKFLN